MLALKIVISRHLTQGCISPVRRPDVPLLIPGLGAQGGDLAALSGQGRNAPNVVNVSRGVMFPSGATPREAAADFLGRIRSELG